MSDNYIIKQGDTYWGLSKKLYGTAPKIDRFPYVWNYENTDYSKGLTDWQMNHNTPK